MVSTISYGHRFLEQRRCNIGWSLLRIPASLADHPGNSLFLLCFCRLFRRNFCFGDSEGNRPSRHSVQNRVSEVVGNEMRFAGEASFKSCSMKFMTEGLGSACVVVFVVQDSQI